DPYHAHRIPPVGHSAWRYPSARRRLGRGVHRRRVLWDAYSLRQLSSTSCWTTQLPMWTGLGHIGPLAHRGRVSTSPKQVKARSFCSCTDSPSSGGRGASSSPPWPLPGTARSPRTCVDTEPVTSPPEVMTWSPWPRTHKV